MNGDYDQHCWDEADRAEDNRARALALLAQHPAEYRDDLEARLLDMDADQLAAYLSLRHDLAADFRKRNLPYYKRYDDGPDLCVEPAACSDVPGEHDPDRERPGYEPRCFGQEPDVWRERDVEMPRLGGAA